MARIERTITIDAPVDDVFGFARDIEKLWGCMPDVKTRNVTRTPDGVGSNAEWDAHVVGPLHLEGRIEYTEVVSPERIVATSSTGPVFTLQFSPRDGGTVVTTATEWTFDTPVVGVPLEALTKWMSHNDITTWMARLKAAVEGGAPEQAASSAQEPPGRLTRSVVIDAPAERVYEDVLDLGSFWTGAEGVATRDVSRTPQGVGSSARIYTHWLGLHMEGVIEIVEATPYEKVAIKASFGPEGPLWTFTLGHAERGTTLTGTGEWHVDIPAVGRRMEAWAVSMHEEFLEQMLQSSKERVQAAEPAMR
ncbi:MAG: SRPBCC family protein [Actinomycetes bacterium]